MVNWAWGFNKVCRDAITQAHFEHMQETERQEAALSNAKPGPTPDRREKTTATFLDWIESIDVALTDAN
jgi:hypothetical protein